MNQAGVSARCLVTPCTPFLRTKRLVLGQLSVCFGCCCGRTDRGKPGVPVEWMKREWRARGLRRRVQLTVSGCLGPCDIANVVRISCAAGDVWLGDLCEFQDYRALVDWATHSTAAEELRPLPLAFERHRFDPFVTRLSTQGGMNR